MNVSSIAGNVERLLPVVRQRRDEIEQARRLPRDLADDLRRTGLFSLTVPRALGGVEATPLDVMRLIETIATADGSTGWCAMVGIGNNVVAGYMPEDGAREVFADPAAPSAGLAAPAGQAVRADGGLRVSGRWAFASGITHSDWVWAGWLMMENGGPRMTPHGPEIVHVCLPVADVTLDDTWHVSGLRGTGSVDVSVKGTFVPERRVFVLLDSSSHRREPLFQMPPLGLFVYQLAAVGLGIARAALDELREALETKVPTLYTAPAAERPLAQAGYARAEAALAAARALLYATVDDIWQAVSGGQAPSARQIALARAASTHAVETVAEITRTANTLAGGSSLYASSSLQRHARDAEAMTHHFTVAPHTWEDAGRVL
ncbi:MAG: acyl-CoA dehydrogenase family protein, partial [Vicinamibacteraceae bacterium]|nr:acyl-CoA dehydrogenase family protein [Vicinamibacteraceae bacterium]